MGNETSVSPAQFQEFFHLSESGHGANVGDFCRYTCFDRDIQEFPQ